MTQKISIAKPKVQEILKVNNESSCRGFNNNEDLEDIVTCCICTEVYTDPKALPCIHTFCMKCIQEVGLNTQKEPGDEMPCPICRQLFKIPTNGFQSLPRNFFIGRLIQVSQNSGHLTSPSSLCDACEEEMKDETCKEIPAADSFCVDCNQKFCVECSRQHSRFKLTKNHKLMSISEFESGQYLKTDLAPDVCEVHEQKALEIYCVDCKQVLCAICFFEEHRNHEGSHISKCVDGFREQIQNNTAAINECIEQAQVKKTELITAKEEVLQRVKSMEREIARRTEKIKQLADRRADCLQKALCSERQSRLKEIQLATDDTDAYLSYLESYNSYCQKIMDKGSTSDICRAVSDLSARAIELQQQCQPAIERRIQDFSFCFRHSELGELKDEDYGNLVGEIEEEDDLKLTERNKHMRLVKYVELKPDNTDAEKITNNSLRAKNLELLKELEIYKEAVKTLETNAEAVRKELETTKAAVYRYRSDPVLIRTVFTKDALKKSKRIRGLTMLDFELFVVHEESSEVVVCSSTMEPRFSRQWNMKNLVDPADIVSCKRNKCLYIFDYKGDYKTMEIFRVDPCGKLITKWSTGDHWGWGLSVTDESTVILTLFYENKLHEYSPVGKLIREINLQSDAGIRHPWHAIKLSDGNFMVSHGDDDDELHRVCIVDGNGNLRKSFGGQCGSTIGQMNAPLYMSVDDVGTIIISDANNSRVLLLHPDLTFFKEILTNTSHGIGHPEIILLSESNRQLYVVDNNWDQSQSAILVFEI